MKKHMNCNPMDLNYEYRHYVQDGETRPLCLEAADPVVVIFEGEYYAVSFYQKLYRCSGQRPGGFVRFGARRRLICT